MLDKEDVDDFDDDLMNEPEASKSNRTLLEREQAVSKLHNDLPPSTIGNQSLLIEVGNKRLYTDRRGNNQVESIYSDGKEADVMLDQQNEIDKELQRENQETPSLSLSEQIDWPFSSHSFKSVSDEDLIATMDEMLVSGTVSERGTQEHGE